MKPIRLCIAVLVLAAAFAAHPAPVLAQAPDSAKAQAGAPATGEPPAAETLVLTPHLKQLHGGYFLGGFPTGDWGKIAGFGLGIDGTDVIQHRAHSPFAIRSSLGLLYNFSRTVDVPAANVGPNDKLSIESKNWSLMLAVGPELSAPNKNLTPFIYGTAGFDTYWTSSELAGTASGSAYSAKHGDSRMSFAWSAGAGVRRHAYGSDMIELSAEYRSGSTHEFLRPEDVSVVGGQVVANRTSHVSDQIIIRLGTVFGY